METRLFVIVILLLSLNTTILAQDLILFKNGDKIKAKVIEVNPDNIKYKKENNLTGPLYTILKKEVIKIQYLNGDVDIFNIYETFTDPRDKVTYKIVKIGGQIWLAENLRHKMSGASNYKAHEIIGLHYNWEAAKKACPSGWHLPTDNEWKNLEISVGMTHAEANKEGWRGTHSGQSVILKKNGSSGLNILLSGCTSSKEEYNNSAEQGYYWTSSLYRSYEGWYRLFSKRASIKRAYINKNNGYSVRCIKN